MRKRCIYALMISLCLTLGACGPADGGEKKQDAAQLLQAEYQSLDGCSMTAEVRCDRADAVEEYTLHCDWTADGEAVVSVLAPEELAGIQAAFSGEELTLIYEDMSLAAGPVSEEALSPAQILPMLMQGICDGYIQEKAPNRSGKKTVCGCCLIQRRPAAARLIMQCGSAQTTRLPGLRCWWETMWFLQ